MFGLLIIFELLFFVLDGHLCVGFKTRTVLSSRTSAHRPKQLLYNSIGYTFVLNTNRVFKIYIKFG